MRNYACVTATMVGLSAVVGTAEAEAKTMQPNVILVMCDDLGWGDVGFNGNEIIRTPNIDKMAGEGVIFNRFYAACAVSSPTRASVLTGRNPYRMGVFTANMGILRPEEITIPELLREEGYATGHFGKWHLGALTDKEKDANRGMVGNAKELNLPKEHGYDDAFVTESKVPTWNPMLNPADNSKPYGTAYWDINGDKVTDNLAGDDSRVIMDRVLPFIKKSSEQGKPFLSVVWFHTPHKPCVAGAEYAAMYSDYSKEFQNYAGCVTAMDEQMGRLRKYLEDNKLDDNTVIFFCSDNGPENGVGVTGGFRARKRSLYEGGVRVPAFVYWRGKIRKPFSTDYPAVTSDYLPTIVSLVGVDPAKCKYELDGVDISAVFTKRESQREQPIIFAYNGQYTIVDNQHKLYTRGDLKELYDITDDPYEKRPLSNSTLSEERQKQLTEALERFKSSFEGKEYGVKSYNKLKQAWLGKKR
ncbi:MAG: sulfatase-like hydrolase/transferase [Rikenellaceae bacterium]